MEAMLLCQQHYNLGGCSQAPGRSLVNSFASSLARSLARHQSMPQVAAVATGEEYPRMGGPWSAHEPDRLVQLEAPSPTISRFTLAAAAASFRRCARCNYSPLWNWRA